MRKIICMGLVFVALVSFVAVAQEKAPAAPAAPALKLSKLIPPDVRKELQDYAAISSAIAFSMSVLQERKDLNEIRAQKKINELLAAEPGYDIDPGTWTLVPKKDGGK